MPEFFSRLRRFLFRSRDTEFDEEEHRFNSSRVLQENIDKIDSILSGLESGMIKCEDANAQLREIIKVFSLVNWHKALKGHGSEPPLFSAADAKEACGVYNLLNEILPMTAFENQDRVVFGYARKVLNEHLRNYCFNPYWRELVKRRGPVEGVSEVKCQNCDYETIQFFISGFLMQSGVICDDCGALFMAPLACKEHERFFEICSIEQDDERKRLSELHSMTIPHCPCGGKFMKHTIPDSDQCPKCHQNSVLKKGLSPYQYFQNHDWYQLDDLQ